MQTTCPTTYRKRTPKTSIGLRAVVAAILALLSVSVTATVSNAAAGPAIVEFWLVDAADDTRIHRITDYSSIRLPLVPDELSIEAVPSGSADSVIMRIEGVVSATENNAPYALGSDIGGDFYAVPELRVPGWLTVSAQAFTGPDGSGTPGAESVLHLYLDQPDFVVRNPADVGDFDPGDGFCSIDRPPFVADDFAVRPAPRPSPDDLKRSAAQNKTAPPQQHAKDELRRASVVTPSELDLSQGLEPMVPVPHGQDLIEPGWQERGTCTLRAAIEEANALQGRQRIVIDSPKGPFNLTKGQLVVNDGVDIIGHGERAVIDAGGSGRVFHVAGDHIVNMVTLELANGNPGQFERGGALSITDDALVQMSDSVVRDSRANFGGGVALQSGGDLLLMTSAIRDNVAGTPENGIDGGGQTQRGGGIFNNRGNVTIRDSAVFDNLAVRGGGLSNFGGTVRVENSSVIDNEALAIGGGIENRPNLGSEGILHLVFATVANNAAGTNGNPPPEDRVGGGLYNDATVFMASSILADNTDAWSAGNALHAPDCHSPNHGDFLSYRNNIVGVLGDSCDLGDYSSGNAVGFQYGTEDAPLDPQLTNKMSWDHRQYRNLQAGSPAIDGGASLTATLYPCADHDGRGRSRPVGAGCDIGAIERQ